MNASVAVLSMNLGPTLIQEAIDGDANITSSDVEGSVKGEAFTFDHITPLWTITTSIVVFLMQYGFALVEAGFCRQNNVVATYCKNVLDVVFGALSSYFIGYYVAYGEHPSDPQVHVHFFHHLVFQATSATIISGAMAERTTLAAYVCLAVWVSAVPFSVAVRWSWGNGWLNQLDPPFHDFAGSTVVHVVGGVAALIGVACVGPRSGRYGYGQRVSFMPHDVASVLSGVLILWVGWYGFNPGSAGFETEDDIRAASNAAITTTLAAASAAAGSVAFVALQDKLSNQPMHVDAVGVGNGVLSGLVSITAGCDVISTDLSIVVGIGGMLSHMVGDKFMEYMQLDDIVGAVAVHGVAGAYGTLAVGLFHPEEGLFISGSAALLWTQFVGIVSISTFTCITVMPVAIALERYGLLRVKPEDEAKGLDCKFGDAASLYITSKNNRLRASYLTLSAYGVAHSELITVLTTLRNATVLPFNAEASTGTVQLQVAAVLAELTIPPPPSGANAKRRNVSGKSQKQSSKDGANPVEHLVFLSHHKAEVGEAARCFAETAHFLLDAVRGIDGKTLPSELSKASTFVRRYSLLTNTTPTDVFLAASDVSDVRRLLQTVSVSANIVLLLSRTCLEKPHVLCELANAFKENKTIILVIVEWPGEGDGGAQHRHAFEFPKNLNGAITEWEEVGEFETAKGSNLTKPDEVNNSLVNYFNSMGSKVLNTWAASGAGKLSNQMMYKYRGYAHRDDDPTASDPTASEFETLKESEDGDGETPTGTALERTDGHEFDNEMTDEQLSGSRKGRKGNSSMKGASSRKGASPPKQRTEEGVTEHATDAGMGHALVPANSPPQRGSTEASHRPSAKAATTGTVALSDDDRLSKPVSTRGSSMDEITECTVEAIGSLEDRLYFLEEHLARGIDSVRREIPDGFPELEKFMAELVGLQRLQAATTNELIEAATTVNVRKNVAEVLEGIWNLSAVSGHMDELVKQRVRAEVEGRREQLHIVWQSTNRPAKHHAPAPIVPASPPSAGPKKAAAGSPTSPTSPTPKRRISILTNEPCCSAPCKSLASCKSLDSILGGSSASSKKFVDRRESTITQGERSQPKASLDSILAMTNATSGGTSKSGKSTHFRSFEA